MNRARQYGKSTTLELLYASLKGKYVVIDISFEAADDCFTSMYALALVIQNKISRALEENGVEGELKELWQKPIGEELPLDSLGARISEFCKNSEREVILLVDEVDKAANNEIFLNFLGLLREKYLKQRVGRDESFKSVILAGVHDIKNLKMKLHPGQVVIYNSPWNIAAEFNIDMSFSENGIAAMLEEYEQDHNTGMDVEEIAKLIYDYTSGYPYLVSYICKKLDEEIAGTARFPTHSDVWTKEGALEAVKILTRGPNTLYDDMIKHVIEYPELSNMLNNILFEGQEYAYHEYDNAVSIGKMFGFVVERSGSVAVANRIFETQLYSFFLAESLRKNEVQRENLPDKNQFVKDGQLDMDLVI